MGMERVVLSIGLIILFSISLYFTLRRFYKKSDMISLYEIITDLNKHNTFVILSASYSVFVVSNDALFKVLSLIFVLIYFIYLYVLYPKITISSDKYKDFLIVKFNPKFILPLNFGLERTKSFEIFRYPTNRTGEFLLGNLHILSKLGELIVLSIFLNNHPVSILWFPEVFLTIILTIIGIKNFEFLFYVLIVIMISSTKLYIINRYFSTYRSMVTELLDSLGQQQQKSFVYSYRDILRYVLENGIKPEIWIGIKRLLPI